MLPFCCINIRTLRVGFKYTFLAVKIISVAIDFCGKIGGHNFTRTEAKTLFVDTICDITLTEYENRFVPFNLAVLFLAWNSI